MRILLLFVALVCHGAVFSNLKQDIYLFDPTTTTMKGVLHKKVFPGAPNY